MKVRARRRNSRRNAHGALAAALAGSLVLAACGGSGHGSSSNGAGGATAVSMFGATETGVKNLNTNWATKYIEKKFGLNISWQLSTDVTTKEPLLFSGGDYPDVIWDGTFTNQQVEQYGQQKILIPLNSYIKKYAPLVWKAINTLPNYKQMVTAPNGNIYSLPLYNYCFHCYWAYNFYINAGLLAKYGLPMPRTTAQFAQVMGDLKKHGVQAPLTGANSGYVTGSSASGYDMDVITYLMNSFLPYAGPTEYFDMNGNHVEFAPAQAQWLAGLKYIHALYQAGDFTKAVFTQQDTEVEQQIANNQAGVVPNGAIQTAIPSYGTAKSHYQDWVPMKPLTGPAGAHYAAFGSVPGSNPVFAITNRASKAAIKKVLEVVNYMYTAYGTETVQFGPEGKYWTYAKKGEEGLVPKQALFDTDWGQFDTPNLVQNEGWSQWGPQDQSYNWRELDHLAAPYDGSNGGEALDQLVEAADYAGNQAKWQFPYGALWTPTSVAQTYQTEATNINNYVGQWTEGLIDGTYPLSAWNKYLSGLNKLGLSQYLKLTAKSIAGPINADVPAYQTSAGDVKYLLTEGKVPALVRKYMIEDGTPASDFTK